MSDTLETVIPSTPEATAGSAQSRVGEANGRPASVNGREVPATGPPASAEADSKAPVVSPEADSKASEPIVEVPDVEIGDGIKHSGTLIPYERGDGDPLYRPLRIYTTDPAASVLEGAVALVNVPYEPLQPGPIGALFEVDDGELEAVNLNDPAVLLRDGRDPSPSDPRFHQQMVYAVCSTTYAAFRQALGRYVVWGFQRGPDEDGLRRLRIRPHATQDRNAYYDPRNGELCFGYYEAGQKVGGRSLPGQAVFTCLSHDVIAHEVTHALLDGLRSHFAYPSGVDVTAFHEGFADLVAVLQHFSYPKVLEAAIRNTQGRLTRAELLTSLARQFGYTTKDGARPLRSAIALEKDGTVQAIPYDPAAEPHDLGSVLVSAVFDAFATVYERKVARYLRLATGGTRILPPGDLPADLISVLAGEASQLASQFLSLIIRAIDYCPPVDLELGEYLRALITADHDLVQDDNWGYREALVDAFAARRLYPRRVTSLAEDALRWGRPERPILPIPELSFARLQFAGDPGNPPAPDELRKRAYALGQIVMLNLDQFGLTKAGNPDLRGDEVDKPVVQSIRSSRRVGPDGQVVFDLVAEVTQCRHVVRDDDRFSFIGGATVILGPKGDVRYVIAKNILNEDRVNRQRTYLRGGGNRYWKLATDGSWEPNEQTFQLLHSNR